MKKIEIENVLSMASKIKDLPIHPVESMLSVIFFPIETSRCEDVNGFDLNVKPSGAASTKELTPGLVLGNSFTKPKVYLGYANLDYSPKFNLKQYLDIVHKSFPLDAEDCLSLTEYSCLLVPENYISGVFDLEEIMK